MKNIFMILISLFFSFSLVGCQNMSQQDIGTLTGGLAGGLIGSTVGQGNGRILAIAAGTLAGAFIGSAIGKNMDENDRMRMDEALENNALGQPAYWRNANTGTAYAVTPVRNVAHRGYRYCREYRTVANIAGKQQQIYGTACRQPDGSWKVVN